jgi:hypothetical protein
MTGEGNRERSDRNRYPWPAARRRAGVHDAPRLRRSPWVLTAGVLLSATVLLGGCSDIPPKVDRITIVNATDYDLEVHVTDRERDGWLPIAIAAAHTEDIAQEVIDQGEVWIFRFLFAGDPIGELSISRAELERSGWRVEVPQEIDQRLRELGKPPSP